jgi:N-acetylglucosamine malate deacetylase 1
MRHFLSRLYLRLERLVRTRQAYRFVIRQWKELSDLDVASQVVSTMRFSQNLQPVELSDIPGQRLFVFAPHPDDEVIGPGGALIKSLARGASVQVLYLTSGKYDEIEVREQEAIKVGKKLGFTWEFLRFSPNEIPMERDFLDQIADQLNEFSPDVILIPFVLDDHPDHRRASEALYRLWLHGEIRDSVPVWAYQVYTPLITNVIVDITEVATQKSEAISLYQSQMRSRNWAHFALGLNAFNSRFLSGRSDASYAECFFQLPMIEYAEICKIYFNEEHNPDYYSQA